MIPTSDPAPDGPLATGATAPDFTLRDEGDAPVTLSGLRGRAVILSFYPADWSPVCGDQMAFYNDVLPEFELAGAALVGISVDSTWCHAAFARSRKLQFPLLSDFEPKGAVARAYGVYRADEGVCDRAMFVIDRHGVVRWSYVSPIDVNPGAAGIMVALDGLNETESTSADPKGGPR